MYKAIDIAKYIVSYAMQQGSPVSNLKLQKILYFLWIEFYRLTGRELFSDSFCAWKLGPVVPSTYYEFCSYAGTPIMTTFNVQLENTDDIKRINSIIDRYLRKSVSLLVDQSHHAGGPWELIYKQGEGNRSVIPFSLIIDLECNGSC